MLHQGSGEKTSWKSSSQWYDSIVGEWGHYYHQEVILPRVLELLNLSSDHSVIDVGCGQGVFARHIPKDVDYVGLDSAKPLIEAARRYHPSSRHRFILADVTQPWPLPKKAAFSHAVCILALQNIEDPSSVFQELAKVLRPGGIAIFVLNHPCFRIPRQSRWRIEESTKIQTREVVSYMTNQRIPIVTHPRTQSHTTWSFHYPLSAITSMSHAAGFVIERIEEWCSPKKSTGAAARAENRARKEFPLFMALILRR